MDPNRTILKALKDAISNKRLLSNVLAEDQKFMRQPCSVLGSAKQFYWTLFSEFGSMDPV